MKKIIAKCHTKLKREPLDSSELKPTQYMAVSEGKHYSVADEHKAGNHTRVVLGFGAGTWFVFNKDWDGLALPLLPTVDRDDIKKSLCQCADSFRLTLDAQKAYILATVQHETAATYKPVKEAYWNNEKWREDNLRYFPYYGRGYVQLTWEFNYQTYSQLLGMDLVSSPDSALIPEIAMYILCHGFKYGTFTGRKLEDYVSESKTDFLNARRCINGMDKHLQIAELAKKHLHYLQTDNRYSA